MKEEVKVFDALKARKVLERANKFLGVLIRESLVKDAPFLKEGELENESDLADDVWEVLQGVPRNCDIGTPEEQAERFRRFCGTHKPDESQFTEEGELLCPSTGCELIACNYGQCALAWSQMPYEEGGRSDRD